MLVSNKLIKIALIFLILLTGCSATQTQVSRSPEQQLPLSGEILMWVEYPFGLTDEQSSKFKKIVNDGVQEFIQLHPQVKIVVEFLPKKLNLTEFVEQIERGAGPDLFAVSFFARNEITKLIQRTHLKPLNEEELDLSQFRPDSLKQVRYYSKIYALPVRLATQVLCYNKDKIQQLPTQLDDLIIQARQGYSVGLHSGFGEAFWGTGIFGGQLFDESGQIILGKNQGWSNWMKWLKNAVNEPNFFLIEDSEALQTAFIQGKLAYITCSSGWLPYLTDALGNNKLGVTVLPGRENRPATPPLWTVAYIFNGASSANQHQISLRVAQFFTNPESQQKVQVAMPFLIPVNKNTIVNRTLFPMQGVLLDQSQTGVVVSLDQLEQYEAIFKYGDLLYKKVLVGEMTPKQAAAQLSQTSNDTFGSYP